MSILITGLNMPTGNEALILTIYPDGQCFEHVYNGSFGARYERKAVPVLPHGRLIDSDALLKKCEFVCTDDDVDVRAVRYSVIDAAPTVIEAEEAAQDARDGP